MLRKPPISVSDVRGTSRLAIDAVVALTSIVETMHHNILRAPGPFGKATQRPAGGITGLVYESIRGATRLVGRGLDSVLARFATVFDGGASSQERAAVLAVLNGIFGDHLHASRNPLAIRMHLRRDGKALSLRRERLATAIPNAICR